MGCRDSMHGSSNLLDHVKMNNMKIVIVLTLSLLIACTQGQKTIRTQANSSETDVSAPTNDTIAKVKRRITAVKGYKPGDKCIGGVTTFNEQGQMAEELDYSSCSVIFKKVVYNYDKTGKIISSTIESEFENVTYNWIYNDKSQLTEQVATVPTRSFQHKLSYTYDSFGNQIEYKGTMADGSAFDGTSRKVFKYQDGEKVKTICYGGDNFDILGYRIEHFYDEDGKEIRSHIYKDPSLNIADTTYFYYEYY
jgi:hypothetical protein